MILLKFIIIIIHGEKINSNRQVSLRMNTLIYICKYIRLSLHYTIAVIRSEEQSLIKNIRNILIIL